MIKLLFLKNLCIKVTKYLSKLKTAIPKEWLEKIKKRESIMTKVNTQLSLINTNIDFNMVTHKDIYRTLIRNQVTTISPTVLGKQIR